MYILESLKLLILNYLYIRLEKNKSILIFYYKNKVWKFWEKKILWKNDKKIFIVILFSIEFLLFFVFFVLVFRCSDRLLFFGILGVRFGI